MSIFTKWGIFLIFTKWGIKSLLNGNKKEGSTEIIFFHVIHKIVFLPNIAWYIVKLNYKLEIELNPDFQFYNIISLLSTKKFSKKYLHHTGT